ncbi:hypothetical protein C2845_PM05G19200 [Panicum miliaceum]|uniref:Uncharacterized protein n=1 Tax=Panicum miliaceum TaxID=4540 RepID=A0A3L6SYP7_PANMI|nr:hypothetical protein C2845_PM05G19200 [Panicum miliaceum]
MTPFLPSARAPPTSTCPPVTLSRFSHLAFAVVDPPTTAPAQVVRDALVGEGVTLVHPDDTPNSHYFEHEAFVTVAIKDYSLEHWNRERIVSSAGPYANPYSADPVCVQGVDFSIVILTVKAKGVADIPFEEYFKNHCGVGSLARLEIVDVKLL